jgi:geranylgeranyl diphosphate synthase type II
MEGERRELDLDALRALHAAKTGALLTASCRMGAIAASAAEQVLDAVTRFGRALGLAFQIMDDILDVTSTPEQLGKGTAKDASRGKNTYPGLVGLDASRAEAQQQVRAAEEALEALGAGADGLRTLARFAAARKT